jgi:hypothetical protein
MDANQREFAKNGKNERSARKQPKGTINPAVAHGNPKEREEKKDEEMNAREFGLLRRTLEKTFNTEELRKQRDLEVDHFSRECTRINANFKSRRNVRLQRKAKIKPC